MARRNRSDNDEDAPENVNLEQEDPGQAQDVARDAYRGMHSLGESRKQKGSGTEIIPDDVPDLVDKMNEMVSSGIIDEGAFAGEPMHDDEEEIYGDTEDEDDEGLMEETEDDGDDPLGEVSSEWGLEDGTDPDPMNGGEDDDALNDDDLDADDLDEDN